MDSFSHVVKSKSSNSAITPKPKSVEKRCQKSCGSHFIIQRPNTVKKRGVYVEKKSSKNRNSKDNLKSKNTASPADPGVPGVPPRPNNKMFVNSVLKILSKSSTGTQYPDTPTHFNYNPLESIRYSSSPSRNNRRTEIIPPRIIKPETRRLNTCTRNKRSKILKAEENKMEETSVIVLQPKRQIIQTPSNYSERSYKDMTDPAVWAKLPCLVNNADSKKEMSDIQIAENNLRTQVGKDEDKNRIQLEITKKVAENSTLTDKKSDNLLYKFFVDLLQTTISVYNMKPEYDQNSKSSVKFEIDLEVADKLNVNEKCADTECVEIVNNEEEVYDESNEEIENLWLTKRYITNSSRFFKAPVRSSIKRKIKIKSPVPYGTPNHKPYISRKARKRRFISLLKRELQIDDLSFEEPQTLYEALKLMAKTKRKAAAVRPNGKHRPAREPECKFDINRRRNIMTPAKPKKVEFEKNVNPIKMKNHDKEIKARLKRREKRTIVIPKKPLRSLEVIGFDYEKPITKLEPIEQEKSEVSGEGSSSTTTIRNRFSFDTFWGTQSSKNQLYSTIFPDRHGSRLRDFQSDLFSDL